VEFATLLVRRRRAAGLTQEMLATQAGMSTQAISALERGIRRFPRRSTVEALADALRLTAAEREHFSTAASRFGRPAELPAPSAVPSPRQLPSPLADFTGRAAEFTEVQAALSSGDPAVAIAVTGMAGAGKTTLSVQAAHAVAANYPDGQVYLDLRGFGSGKPLEPLEALSSLLAAFGFPAAEVPLTVNEASARWRTLIADRRALILLDNARDRSQVEHLLPGTGPGATIVTSRQDLSLLSATKIVRLGLLSLPEGFAFLESSLAADRVALEPAAAAAIVEGCGRLPLALRIAAGRLSARPSWPLAHLAELLGDERRRLDQLEHPDLGVRASFAISIEQLADSDDAREHRAAEAFVRFAIPDGPDLSVEVAAELFGTGRSDALEALEDLCDLHLAESTSPGRYRLHDLLRTYSGELARTDCSAGQVAAALTRIVDLYATVAWQSVELGYPGASRLPWLGTQPLIDVGAPRFEDLSGALAWLDGQRPHLVAVVARAARTVGVPAASIVRLAIGLNPFYVTRGHWLDWLRINQTALPFAGQDRVAAAIIHNDLGLVHFDLTAAGSGKLVDSVRELHRSLALFEELDDRIGVAMALTNLSHVLDLAGEYEQAIGYSSRSLAINQELNSYHGQALSYVNLGNSYGGFGRLAEQRSSYDNAVELSATHRDEPVLAVALLGSGVAYRTAGKLDLAVDHLRRSADVFESVNDQLGLAEALDELGVAYRFTGDLAAAVAEQEEALEIAEYYDDGRRQLSILHHLAVASAELGNGDAATAYLAAAGSLGARTGLTVPPELEKLLRDGTH
jgi:tetratricopeptide (TPR) repeat protein/transcriptional regulator with XRE-family HTH domain